MKTGAINYLVKNQKGLRFDASFHLSDGLVVKRMITSSPYKLLTIKDVTSDIFYGNRAKRMYVSKKEKGIPFLSSSDILQADLENVKLVSKKYTPSIKEMTLKKGWTLISRSGTIGNCAFANARHAQKLASEHVIRLVPNDILRGGLVYAYLASKYGHSLLTQGTFGAVIQHIEPNFIASLPIPKFPEDFQKEVDDLIQESARLREEATEALEIAKQMIIEFCELPFEKGSAKNVGRVGSSVLLNSLNMRFDAPFFINDGVNWIKRLNKETVLLSECNIKTWYPGMFKRSYVKNGYPYIKGSELFLSDPFKNCEQLSRSRTPKLDELWLKEGQLLISCAGACGLVKLITKEYEEKKAIGSPDIIRLISEDTLFTKEYLFTYLQIPAIYDFMQSLKYGSVIERFDTSNIETIPIVKPTQELSNSITDIIKKYAYCTYRAFNAEEKAISMVEEEIEKWNK